MFVLVALLAMPAGAQVSTSVRVELGDGVAVERMCPPSSIGSWMGCFAWTPIGFSFGDASRWLLLARAFARVPATGAILAVPGRPSDMTYSFHPPRLLRTEDGGEHWTSIPWSGSMMPTIFAFDHHSLDGVAAGDAGNVWSTDDGGLTWDQHGSGGTWSAVAIADREIVLLDASGNVYRSHDGGFARESVVTDPTARLEQRDEDIVVHTDTADYVVRRGSSTRRTTH